MLYCFYLRRSAFFIKIFVNIRIHLILPESSHCSTFVAYSMGLSSFTFSWWAPKDASFLQ